MNRTEETNQPFSHINLRGDLDSFRRAVRAMMDDHEPLASGSLSLGVMQMVGGQCNLAVEEFDRAVAEAPDSYRPYYYRGTALLKMERYAEAMTDLDQAIARNPELGMAYLERALCHQELGSVALAERDLQSALMISGATIEGFAQSMGILRARCFDLEALMEGDLPGHRLTMEEIEQVMEPLQ